MHHRRVAAGIAARRAAGEEIVAAELASHYERGHDTVAALRAYAVAAQNALGHFAPREAEQLADRGLSLLDRCPDGMARMELEFELVRPAGFAKAHIYGIASPEALAQFHRGRELCDALPQTPEYAVALSGLAWVCYVCGDFDASLVLVERLNDIAARFNNDMLAIFSLNLAGVALIGKGRFVEGCASLKRGIALCQQVGDTISPAAFIVDPEVSMHLNMAVPLADLGLADQARSHLAQGLQRATRIGQPFAMALSHWCGGMVYVRLHDVELVAHHAEILATIVERNMLTQGDGPSQWLRGWVQAQRGDPRAGFARIMAGYQCNDRLGMYAGCPEALSYATEALILAGDWDSAQRQYEATLQLAERIGEQLVVSRTYLLGARIAQGRNDVAAARKFIRDAVRLAREQQALSLELDALVVLVEIEPNHTNLEELRAVHQRMSEGFDAQVYRRAHELLTA